MLEHHNLFHVKHLRQVPPIPLHQIILHFHSLQQQIEQIPQLFHQTLIMEITLLHRYRTNPIWLHILTISQQMHVVHCTLKEFLLM
jgi:hypothetical protein